MGTPAARIGLDPPNCWMIPKLLRSPHCAWLLLVALHGILAVRALRNAPTTDFQIYWDTARTLGEGGTLFGGGEPHHELFLYGPIFAICFRPLAMLDAASAHVWWTVVGLLALGASGLLLRDAMKRQSARQGATDSPWPIALGMLVLTEPLISNFRYGNTNTLLVWFLVVGFWGLLRGRRFLAGTAFAMAAVIKVTPILLLPWLILRREWRATAGFVLGLVLFVGVAPGLYLGPERMFTETFAWIHAILLPAMGQTDEAPAILTRAGASLPRALSAILAAVPEGAESSPIQIASWSTSVVRGIGTGLALLMLASLLLLTRAPRGDDQPSRLDVSCALVIATPALVSPTSHLGHFLQLLPLLVVLAHRTMPGAESQTRAKSTLIVGVGTCILLYGLAIARGWSGNALFPVTVLNLILWIGGMSIVAHETDAVHDT